MVFSSPGAVATAGAVPADGVAGKADGAETEGGGVAGDVPRGVGGNGTGDETGAAGRGAGVEDIGGVVGAGDDTNGAADGVTVRGGVTTGGGTGGAFGG